MFSKYVQIKSVEVRRVNEFFSIVKIEINEQELRAMQYDFSDFDDGKEFINQMCIRDRPITSVQYFTNEKASAIVAFLSKSKIQ